MSPKSSLLLGMLLGCSVALADKTLNIVLSNDDGWAEKNIRYLYDTLKWDGHNVIISAPATDRSSPQLDSTFDFDPVPLVNTACQYNSCPVGSPAAGRNESDTRFNYVNSFPQTAMRFGIKQTASDFFDPKVGVELAISGVNVGSNVGLDLKHDGTAGAASWAAQRGKTPAIAVSGPTGQKRAWNESTPVHSAMYALATAQIVQTLADHGRPFLPSNVFLNVNLPEVAEGKCDRLTTYGYILTRRDSHKHSTNVRCYGSSLPTEKQVMDKEGCWVSISVLKGSNLLDAAPDRQADVAEVLFPLLSCLPRDHDN